MKLWVKLLAVAARAGTALPDALMVAGAGGVAYGASLVYVPAGFIAAGMFALVAGWLLARGAK